VTLPLSPSLTTVGESHITPSFLTHIDHQSPNSLVFPTDIPFGDSIPSPKPNSSFWIGFCNIGGFPSHARNNPKVMEIKHFIVAHNLDLFGGCKANLNWCNLLDHIQLKKWFHTTDSCHTFSPHNLHETFRSFQFGGTLWIRAGHMATHITSSSRAWQSSPLTCSTCSSVEG